MNIIPFQYQGIAIQESCWIEGTPYFTGQAIGEFLEYKEPRKAINKIVEPNPHINDPRWSVDVKLTSTDDYYFKGHSGVNLTSECPSKRTREIETRVYNPIALQLITFESRQPKAIDYKIAVANLVWALMTGNLKPSKWSQKGDLVSAARQIFSMPPSQKRGPLVRDLAERDGVTLQTAYRRIQYVTGQSLKTNKGKRKTRVDKGSTKHPGEKEKIFTYLKEHPGAQVKGVKELLGLRVSYSRILTWIRENKHKF